MFITKTKLDELLERYKDLDHVYVKNKLVEYENLVQYYSILCTKQYMKDFNATSNEWSKLEKTQFKEEM
jgi:hypothetical protein